MKGIHAIEDTDSVEETSERRAAYGRSDVYERGFDEDVDQCEANTCPECEGRVTTNIQETVCDDCGLVIDDAPVDRGPEWTIVDGKTSAARRVGAPNTVMRHDRGLGTNIGLDVNGQTASTARRKRRKLARMRREHSRSKFDSKADRNQMKGFLEIRRLTGALGLGWSLREQACQLFRTAQKEGLLLGRSIEAIASGCVYAVCRLNEQVLPMGELEAVAAVSRARIENGYSVLNRELNLPVPPMAPIQYLRRVAAAVGVSANTERRARAILEAADGFEGVHPGGVTAGALYLAGQETGESVTQSELATAAEVSEATIRTRYRELA